MRAARRPRLARAALPCLSALLLLSASCAAHAVTGFTWKGEGGESLPFAEGQPWPKGEEGSFAEGRRANRYTLAKKARAPAGTSLVVIIRRGGEGSTTARATLAVSAEADGTSVLARASFPILAERAALYLTIEADSTVSSLGVTSDAGGGNFSIESIAFGPAFRGLSDGPGPLRVSSGFSLVKAEGRQVLTILRPFAAPRGRGEAERFAVLLDYGKAVPGDPIRLEARRADGSASRYSLRTRPGGSRTVLDAGTLPADADSLSLIAPEGLDIRAFYSASLPEEDFELADLGRVLLAEAPASDFSAFRWDALPSVLVLDFKDYDTQGRYLKRLAFFVEKLGFRGRLASDEEIRDLHGWNAHDYRAEDLASFFQAARKRRFPLNDKERALEALLLREGILLDSGGTVAPGRGAVISIARESGPALRWTFATHESTHALFFVDADYRAFARSLWASLGDGEKWFWKTYLGWAAYDVGSEYLMGNEFQAYLLQQPLAAAEEYFTKRKSAELLEKHPELADRVGAYMAEYGKSFEARARQLDAWLGRKYGIGAGQTVFLTRR
jgi:hypothetical protein